MLKFFLSLLILLFALSQSFDFLRFSFIDSLERLSQDIRLKQMLVVSDTRSQPSGIKNNKVVIVDIDEKSLQAYGQWPWSRDILARLVNTLFDEYGIKVLGFDMVFAEPSPSAFSKLSTENHQLSKAQLEHLSTLPVFSDHDKTFAYSLLGRNVVSGVVFKHNAEAPVNNLSAALAELDQDFIHSSDFLKANSAIANIESLQNSGVTTGFFDNPLVDEDGLFRRAPLLQVYDNKLFMSLSLAVAQAALDGAPLDIEFDQYDDGSLAVNYIQLGRYVIHTGKHASATVPYLGGEGSFEYISAVDILNAQIDPHRLNNKIVLLGTTAAGLKDLRATPVDKQMAGVEVHANIIAGILEDRIQYAPLWTLAAELLFIAGTFVALTLVLNLFKPLLGIIFSIVLLSLLIYSNLYFWQQGLILPLANSLLLFIGLFIYYMAWGFLLESRNKRQLSKIFGQYVPPELVVELSKRKKFFSNHAALSLKGESKELSVMFSDVRGFTSISESLPPEQLTQLMNKLLTPLTKTIHQHQGTIDKYMGDAIMAFWGAPLDNPDHAAKAIAAGLTMLKDIEALHEQFSQKNWPRIKVGIGINTGLMNVGNMGSEFRMAYTVLGDAVNLASRIEGLTKYYGVNFLVSEMCQQQALQYCYRIIDKVQVKGKNEAVLLYEPIALTSELNAERLALVGTFNQAFAHYLNQQWSEAVRLLTLLQQVEAQPLYQLFIDRIDALQQQTLSNTWNGVFVHQTK
jgi:adenylate cyclase